MTDTLSINASNYGDANDSDTAILNPQAEPSFLQQRNRWWKFHAVEPLIFIYVVVDAIGNLVLANAVEIQYCKSVLGIYDNDKCLDTESPHFNEVQSYFTIFNTIRVAIEVVWPAIMGLFLGGWSDINGRRPVLLAAILGNLIKCALWSWGVSTQKVHPNFFLLFSIPMALSGGSTAFGIATYSYICDITSVESRGTRLGLMYSFSYAGTLFANFLINRLVETSYFAAYAAITIMIYFSFLYAIVSLKESLQIKEPVEQSTNQHLFQLIQLKQLYNAVFTKPSSHVVTILISIILMLAIFNTQLSGEASVYYLFFQKVDSWTIEKYSIFNMCGIISNMFMTFIGTWIFTSVFKLPDLIIMAICSFINLLSEICMMFANQIWQFYAIKIFSTVTCIMAPVKRVFISRLIPAEDIGKVFSCFAIVENLVPLLGCFLYSYVYNASLSSYIRSIFTMSAMLSTSVLLIVTYVVHIYTGKLVDQSRNVNSELTNN